MTLEHKIDFALVFTVDGANPNGCPLNDNRPRQDLEGRGEMSAECIKRKIRNAVQDKGISILVQSNGRETDEHRSIKSRLEGDVDIKKIFSKKKIENKDVDELKRLACEKWFDVRAFGQLITHKGMSDGGIRGPVSIRMATSINPVTIRDLQITKSVNGEDGDKKGSDTIGLRSIVDFGLYVVFGSISPQLAEKTGFTKEDAVLLKEALMNIFENDVSSARPAGSMEVRQLYWWEHDSKLGKNSAKVHRSLKITQKVDNPASFEDFEIEHEEIDGVKTEIIEF